MTKNKTGGIYIRVPAANSTVWERPDGGGLLGRPFRLNGRSQQDSISQEATAEENTGAEDFRQLLRGLSPDFDQAFREVAGLPPADAAAMPDRAIDDIIGPILKEHGYDLDELAVRRKKSRVVRKLRDARPRVFDVDLTEPLRELKELQDTLQWIVDMERSILQTAYCIRVRRESAKRVVFAPLNTWKEKVAGGHEGGLVAHVSRACRSLAAAANIDFRQWRVVHFLPCEQAAHELASKFQQSPPKETSEQQAAPFVIVDGDTVVAALPHENGKDVVSAIVAIEIPAQGVSQPPNEIPDMGVIIAHAEGAAALRADSLS